MPTLPAALALAPAAILPAVALASGPSPMEMVWAPDDGHEAVAHQLLEAESRAKNHTSKDRARQKTASTSTISTYDKLSSYSEESVVPTARAGAISGAVGGGVAGALLGGFGGYMRNSSPYDAAAGAGLGLLAGMGIGGIGGAVNGGLQGLVRDQLRDRGMSAGGHVIGTGQAGMLVGAPIGALTGAVQGGLVGGPPGALVGGLAGGAYGALDGAISGGINGGVRSLLEKESHMSMREVFEWPAEWGPRPKTAAVNIKGKILNAIEDLLSKHPHMGTASHSSGGRVADAVDALDQADDVDGLSKLYEDLQSKTRSAGQDASDARFRAEKDYESGLRKSEKDMDHQQRQQDQFNARAPGGAGYNFNNATKPILDRLSALGPVPLVAGGLGLALLDKPIGELLTPTAQTAGNLIQDELFGVWDRSNIEDVLALEFAKSLGKGTGDAVTGLGKGLGQAATYGLQQGVGQAMLPGVLKSDPMLRGASPDQQRLLGDAYTSMLRTAPNVAMIPHARDNYLRTVLQTGAGPDYATIGALARTEKDLTAANPWMGGGR